MDAYGCEAPQYLDFGKLDEPEDKMRIEEFFGRDTESRSQSSASEYIKEEEISFSEDDRESNGFCYFTPKEEIDSCKPNKRLSKSMVCLADKLSFDDDGDEENEMKKISEEITALVIDEDGQPDEGTNRGRSMKIVPKTNRTESLRRARSNSGSRVDDRLRDLNKVKPSSSPFVSLQECVKRFEQKTPLRFHSKPKGTVCSLEKLSGPKTATIPQSPALATKERHRVNTVMSTAEMEIKEYEEVKKFKIKAKPVNQKILGPVKPLKPVRKSPTTVIPFNITEMQRKVVEPPKIIKPEFHARPAPHPPTPTKPVTTATRKPRPKPQKPAPVEKKKWSGITTKPEPFSFDLKDKQMRLKHEAMREEFYENERKMREFRCKPMPTSIYKQPSLPVKLTKKAESMENLKALRHEDEPKPFKARPAPALKTFEPKKIERPLIEITQFQLSTELRMRERQEFDEKRRQKEKLLEEERQRRDEETKQKELAEIQRQRKETIHIANPIKKFKDVPCIDPRPVTVPMTPQLVSRYKNKENLVDSLNTSYEE